MSTIISGRDIVVVGQQPWDTEIGSNCKDVALEFSRHNRVLYINAPLDRNTLLRQRRIASVQKRLRVIRGEMNDIQSVGPTMWVVTPSRILESINWLPASGVHTFLNKVNNQRFADDIQQAMNRLGFENVILFNDNDIFRSFYLKELLQPDVSIYYLRDFVVSGGYWRKHGVALEPQLVAKSDLCITNSNFLRDYCLRENPRSFNAGQGCDLELAAKAEDAPCPADLQQLARPIIGYTGALVSSRLDIEVLRYIAEQRPDWSIALIGPEDEAFKKSVLHDLPNVHFMGFKAPGELPSYVRHFDVCLNPQLLNQMTIGNYPRKLDEYLALGKPVVATRNQFMQEGFGDYVYVADNKQEYVQKIALALREDNPARQQQRRNFANTHSWENHVAKIYKAILGLYADRAASQPASQAANAPSSIAA